MCCVHKCPAPGRELTGLCAPCLDAWYDSPEYAGIERDAAGLAVRPADVLVALERFVARINADRGAR